MKIINVGKLNTRVKCSYCDCEYEFDANDVCEELDSKYLCVQTNFFNRSYYKKFVICPICKERKYIEIDRESE